MPPKKTKKELEQAKETQRLKEEEEKRKLQLEEQERMRLEQQTRREHQAQRIKQQSQRLERESKEVYHFHQQIHALQKKLDEELARKQEWLQYLQCDVKPNPKTACEISSFILQLSEERLLSHQSSQVNKMIQLIGQGQSMVQLLRSTGRVLQSKGEGGSAKMCDKFIEEIGRLLEDKFQQIVERVLSNSTQIINEAAAVQQQSKKKNSNSVEAILKFNSLHNLGIGFYLCLSANKGSFKIRSANFSDFGLEFELPAKLMTSPCIAVAHCSPSSRTQQLTHYVVGGIFSIQFYDFMQTGKKGTSWLINVAYESKLILKQSKIPMPTIGKETSFAVTIYLPDNLYVDHQTRASPKIMALQNHQWQQIPMADPPLFELPKKSSRRSIKFINRKPGTFALALSRTHYLPFRHFELRMKKQRQCLLSIKTARIDFEILIGNGHLLLLQPNNKQLSELNSQPSKPGQFFYKLKTCGINLMPSQLDFKTLGIPLRNRLAEEKAIEEISILVSKYFIKGFSHHNKLPLCCVAVSLRDNLEFQSNFLEDNHSDWEHLCWWHNKVAVIQNREYDEEALKQRDSHIDMTMALKQTKFGKIAVQVQDVALQMCIKQTLRCSRLLTLLQLQSQGAGQQI